MFDPIEGPANDYQGPASGLGTGAGDNWKTAVEKINAGFKNIASAIKGGVEHLVEAIDTDARKDIAELREELAALQIKVDAQTTAGNQTPQAITDPSHTSIISAAQIADVKPPAPTAIDLSPAQQTTAGFGGAPAPAPDAPKTDTTT